MLDPTPTAKIQALLAAIARLDLMIMKVDGKLRTMDPRAAGVAKFIVGLKALNRKLANRNRRDGD